MKDQDKTFLKTHAAVCECGHGKMMHLQCLPEFTTFGLKRQGCSVFRCRCKEYEDDFTTTVVRAREVIGKAASEKEVISLLPRQRSEEGYNGKEEKVEKEEELD